MYQGEAQEGRQIPECMIKEDIGTNRRENLGRNQLQYHQYLDRLDSALNQCKLDKMRPYWRNHSSQKGKLQHTI